MIYRTNTPNKESPRWMRYSDVAKILHVTPSSVHYWCQAAQNGIFGRQK